MYQERLTTQYIHAQSENARTKIQLTTTIVCLSITMKSATSVQHQAHEPG
jgi:hypothetical protein